MEVNLYYANFISVNNNLNIPSHLYIYDKLIKVLILPFLELLK